MVITGRRNGESRSSKFKKAPADLADFGRFFTENPKNFKKQTGKHRVNDGQAPFRNTVGIGVFSKKHRFLNESGINEFLECCFVDKSLWMSYLVDVKMTKKNDRFFSSFLHHKNTYTF